MDITVVIIQLIQLFILIGIGYLLGKTSLFRGMFVQQLTNLVLNLTMPCMILSSVMNSIDAPALPFKRYYYCYVHFSYYFTSSSIFND